MNVSVATVFVVVVAIVVAAHKLRLVLCLCRRAYVAVVPSACLPAASAVPVSLFSTLYAKALLHNAKAMAMAMTKRCKCCQPKVKGSIKRALQCGCNAEAVKILLSRLSSVCIWINCPQLVAAPLCMQIARKNIAQCAAAAQFETREKSFISISWDNVRKLCKYMYAI